MKRTRIWKVEFGTESTHHIVARNAVEAVRSVIAKNNTTFRRKVHVGEVTSVELEAEAA